MAGKRNRLYGNGRFFHDQAVILAKCIAKDLKAFVGLFGKWWGKQVIAVKPNFSLPE